MQCTAKAKSTGKKCTRSAMPNGKCYVHGGATPKGIANPNTKHGRYSKDLPTRMLADYEAERTDPEILNLSEAIAVVRARQRELFRQVDKRGAASLFNDLSQAWKEFEAAQRAKDGPAMAAIMAEVGQLIKRGAADSAKWREITALMEQERKLTETEQKRRVSMQTMLTAEKGQLLVKALLASVNAHVSDKRALAAIGADIMALVGDGAS